MLSASTCSRVNPSTCVASCSHVSNLKQPTLTNYSDHPRYHVAERADPYDAHEERDGEPVLESGFLAIGDCTHEYQMNGPCCDPSGLP